MEDEMSSLMELLKDVVRVIKLASKPTAEEYKLFLKVVLAGMSVLGVLGFFFQLIGSTLEFARFQAIPFQYTVLIGLVLLMIILAFGLYLRSRSEI
uniref:Protein translocase subunit SecE n=1 Tax=Thermofilum pendens TaxID=2269 RepID=A0A7C1P042_THEPE